MNYVKAVAIFLLAFFLQGSVVNILAVNGATPNLLLCLAVLFSFLYDEENYGLILGPVFGILYDICYMPYVGVSSIGFFFLAFAVVMARELLNRENIGVILVIAAIATFVFNIYIWCVYSILGSNITILYVLKKQPLLIMWNVIITGILYAVVIKKVLRRRRDLFYR